MPPETQQPSQPPSLYPTQPSPSMTLPIAQPKREGPPKLLIIIPIVVLIILLFGSTGFAFWAYGERNDYRDNVNQKIAVAVEAANEEQRAALEAEFLEREKSPFRTYNGPAQFGAIIITYPRTWSASVDESSGAGTPLLGLFHPNFVPGEKSNTAIALKLEVIEQSYDEVLGDYESDAKKGILRISPYIAPKVPDVLGARIDGEVEKAFNGSAVVFPLRDKTIRLSTLSPQFVPDFNNIILAEFQFTP